MAIQSEGAGAPISSGVETLIERLRQEGVEQGRAQAEQLVHEVRRRADKIIADAEEEAERVGRQARLEAEQLERSGREALRVAARDTLLSLKAELGNRFAREVEGLVSREMHSEELLRELIRAVVVRAAEQVDEADRLEILLPRDAVGLEELRRNPDELSQGELTRFVKAISEEIAARGVRFGRMGDDSGGILLRLVDKSMTIELTDRAVAALLLDHLQPRFRALLEGIVQ